MEAAEYLMNNHSENIIYSAGRRMIGTIRTSLAALVIAASSAGCTEIIDPCQSLVDKVCGCPEYAQKEFKGDAKWVTLSTCFMPGITTSVLKSNMGYGKCLTETLQFKCPDKD